MFKIILCLNTALKYYIKDQQKLQVLISLFFAVLKK